MKFSTSQCYSFGKKPKGKIKLHELNKNKILEASYIQKRSSTPSPLDYQNVNYRSTTPEWR